MLGRTCIVRDLLGTRGRGTLRVTNVRDKLKTEPTVKIQTPPDCLWHTHMHRVTHLFFFFFFFTNTHLFDAHGLVSAGLDTPVLLSVCSKRNFKWESIRFGCTVCVWEREKREMKQNNRAGRLFEVSLSLRIYKTIGHGEMNSAVQCWNNLLLLRETVKWICCWADNRYWTPADCLYNTDLSFQQVLQKKLLALFNTQGQTGRHEKQRNRPTFFPSNPGLGQMRIQSWKILFLWDRLVKERGGVKWRGEGANQAIKQASQTEGMEKKEQNSHREWGRQRDGRWKIAILLECCGRGNRRRRRRGWRGPSHQRRRGLWVWPLQERTTSSDPWHL